MAKIYNTSPVMFFVAFYTGFKWMIVVVVLEMSIDWDGFEEEVAVETDIPTTEARTPPSATASYPPVTVSATASAPPSTNVSALTAVSEKLKRQSLSATLCFDNSSYCDRARPLEHDYVHGYRINDCELVCAIDCERQEGNVEEDKEGEEDEDEDEDENYSYADDLAGDPDYEPGFFGDGTCSDDEDVHHVKQNEREIFACSKDLAFNELKYIVYQSSLFDMMNVCKSSECGAPCRVFCTYEKGSLAVFEARCENGHHREYYTQPTHGTMPLGNLESAAAILFSGSCIAQLLTFFSILNVAMISLSTYLRIQRSYLLSSVRNVWQKEQFNLLNSEDSKDKKYVLGGDARCCSPGHCAKFSSYTLMDVETSKIVNVRLVQTNEGKNSNAMELEGLKRCLTFLKPKIAIASITTDRHPQVQKYLRVSQQNADSPIRHFYDVWHIAKSIRKKIEKAMQAGPSESLATWKGSFITHLYWCAMTSDGNGDLIEEKWMSLLSHVRNVHTHPENKLFKECEHGALDRKWMDPACPSYKVLRKIVTDTCLVRDVRKMSPGGQTSSVESYHNIVTHFAPKRLHYFYASMDARVKLSALHFNENSRKSQATTIDGIPKFAVSLSKARQGEPVAKPVTGPPTYAYITPLLEEVLRQRNAFPTLQCALTAVKPHHDALPRPVASKYKRAPTSEVIEQRLSRYNLVEGRSGLDLR